MHDYDIMFTQHLIFTAHAVKRLTEHGITTDEVYDALLDGVVTTQAGGRREIRGPNGITVITDPDMQVVITVLPRGARPATPVRPGCGVSQHRPNRQGPKNRDDRRRPRR